MISKNLYDILMITFKMIGRHLTVITLMLCAATAWGDSSYLSDRAAALDLAQKGKPEEAATEFSRLSETGLASNSRLSSYSEVLLQGRSIL